uniref:Uncharacterized protein n=1 Tax=Branchiostoma floridae TaxID=7739 RepID=C3Y447_BRAFL|eukprot:XP_002609063.1 hypothetical protein BRAFLDRAFT_96898 [Branchiostoma floridae]
MAGRLCLLVLSGLPGSGKTSLARKLQECWQSEVAVVHVCFDDLIPEDLKLERPEEGDGEDDSGDQQVGICSDSADSVHIIKHTIGFCEVLLHCDVETALKRNMERQCPVARETVVAMATKMEPPNPNRHSWEVMSFLYDQMTGVDEETALEEIRELVAVAIANPVLAVAEENMEEKEQSRLVCSMNVLHQADQILRKCISDVMGSAKADNRMGKPELKILGRQLNKIRAELLDDLKHHKLQLPPIECVGPRPGQEQEGLMSSCSSLTDMDSPTEVEVIEVKTLEGYILRLFRERRAANTGTKST